MVHKTQYILNELVLYRAEQRKRMFFKWLLLGKGGVDDVGHELADSSDNAVSVATAHWNAEHRVFEVEQFFFRNSDSVVTVQRLFRRKFNVERRGAIPDRNTTLWWVEAFRTTGSVTKRKPPGLLHSVRTLENVDTVRRAVLSSPRRSARRQALALGTPRRSLYRILHDKLKFHPYKIMIVQQLAEGDFAQCRDFCENALAILTVDANAVVMMSDEAHFHLNGFVNKQNCRFWAAENPRELHQRPLHSSKVTVWCGVSKVGIVGPYFFEDCSFSDFGMLHRHVKQLPASRTPKAWGKHERNVVPTGWCHSSHGESIDGSCSTHVPPTCDLPFRRCFLAPTFPWSIDLQLFFVGIPQV